MPDPLDTRDALRELVGIVLILAYRTQLLARDYPVVYRDIRTEVERVSTLAERLDAPAPPPPARTVTRAQYDRALGVLRDWMGYTPKERMDGIMTIFDLRVADDTEAPHA